MESELDFWLFETPKKVPKTVARSYALDRQAELEPDRYISPTANHGTQNGYDKHKCRCVYCSKAKSLYDRSRRKGRKEKDWSTRYVADIDYHGTLAGYNNKIACRCRPCTLAMRDYMREYRRRRLTEPLPIRKYQRILKPAVVVVPTSNWMNNRNKRFIEEGRYVNPDATHGSIQGYNYHKCRCAYCTEAVRLHSLQVNQRKKAELKAEAEFVRLRFCLSEG